MIAMLRLSEFVPRLRAIAGSAVAMTIESRFSMKRATAIIRREKFERGDFRTPGTHRIRQNMDHNYDREIGGTGKLPKYTRYLAPVSCHCVTARAVTPALRLGLDGGGEQLAQARFDLRIARGALAPPPRPQWNHRLPDVAMAAGTADIAANKPFTASPALFSLMP